MVGDVEDPDPTRSLRESMPLAGTLGIEVSVANPDEVVARARWLASHTTTGGAMHGGHLMALADSIAAFCAFLNLPEGASTATIESKTNFMRPVMSGHVDIVATPLHSGRATIVVQVDIKRDDGKLAAHTIQTQAVLVADRDGAVP